eukprot:2450232-Rhodomonas_salina.3
MASPIQIRRSSTPQSWNASKLLLTVTLAVLCWLSLAQAAYNPTLRPSLRGGSSVSLHQEPERDFNKMKLSDLQKELRGRGLSTKGLKGELIQVACAVCHHMLRTKSGADIAHGGTRDCKRTLAAKIRPLSSGERPKWMQRPPIYLKAFIHRKQSSLASMNLPHSRRKTQKWWTTLLLLPPPPFPLLRCRWASIC